MVKIAVAGAKGHMGKMIIDAVWNTEGAELVCALAHKETDHVEANEDAGASLGFNSGVKISCDNETLRTSGAQVLIDFTRRHSLSGSDGTSQPKIHDGTVRQNNLHVCPALSD